MNPPYSNPKPFIEKAWKDSKHCKIVCLVKCDPSTRWWSTFWNYEDIHECCGNALREFKNVYYCDKCGAEYDYLDLYDPERKRGPKPGCEVRFFPKRIKFDPPQQLIDSGGVWRVKNKWVQKCVECRGYSYITDCVASCSKCKGKGYSELSGPTFPCALIIMDRRGLC